VESAAATTNLTSPTYTFTTTNYVTTNAIFDVTTLEVHHDNLDDVPWTDTVYDDSGWSGLVPDCSGLM